VLHFVLEATKKNLDPYIKFLGLETKEGQKFIRKVFERPHKSDYTSVEQRINFCEKLFSLLSTALEKRQLGLTHISDDELGKLVVLSLLVIKANSAQLKYQYGLDGKGLDGKLIELVYTFINNHHSLVPYIKSGIRFDRHSYDELFDGKTKGELALWCAEQGIVLSQEEIKFLSKHWFVTLKPPGQEVLRKFRSKVKKQLQRQSS